jgi:hypothetical protein
VGKGFYGWSFAHSVRIDKGDNIWGIDTGSDMIIRFTPAGQVRRVFGRRKESADHETGPWENVDAPRRTWTACSASRPTSPGTPR